MPRRSGRPSHLVLMLSLVCGGTLACATGPKAPLFTVDQAELKAAVTERLASDPSISEQAIVVEVDRTTVRLTGTVADEEQRVRAGALALQARGVRGVINRLEVAEPGAVVAEGIGD